MQTAILTLVLILTCPAAFGQATPESIWQEIDLAQANQLSEETGKPVLLYFTSPICLACHRMDNTTFQDKSLISQIENETIPIRPTGTSQDALQKRFGVVGYPTLCLIQTGEDPIKLTGYWEPEKIATWLTEPGSHIQRHNINEAPVGDVHDLAIDLLLSDDLPKSAEAMAAFWTRSTTEPGVTNLLRWMRRDRYPSLLKQVCKDPEAHITIRQLIAGFDTNDPDSSTHPALVRDWVVLTLALGEAERLDDWINRTLEQDPQTIHGVESVFDRLMELKRHKDAGQVASEELWARWVARHQSRPTGNPVSDAMPEKVLRHEQDIARDKLENYVLALLAADRQIEAEQIQEVLSH
jgi:thioredoxin-related protein